MAQLKQTTLNVSTHYWLLTAMAIAFIGKFTNLDLMIEDFYYDTQLHTFIWRNRWFAKEFMHLYVKEFIIAVALVCIGFVLIDLAHPLTFMNVWLRIRLRFITAAAILVPSLLTGLKHLSILHCPWDIQRYGGTLPYIGLFDIAPPNIKAGHCFPAGHAATGLWLAALCVFWLPHKPRTANIVFCLGLGTGFVLGWVQQMRGAHFLTHTLWSTWIAAAVIFIMLSLSKPWLKNP